MNNIITSHLKHIITTMFCLSLFFTQGQSFTEMMASSPEDYSIKEIELKAKEHFDNIGRGKGTGFKQYQRWLYQAKLDINNNPSFTISQHQQRTQTSSNSSNWTPIGPIPNSPRGPREGRVTAFDVDPNNSNILFAGSNGGGVWKSTDGGNNWSPKTDFFATMEIWAIAVAPSNSNTIYAGTKGLGVIKSTDGGETWSQTGPGIPNNTNIQEIRVDYNNENNAWIAGNKGVRYTQNGGTSWSTASGINASAYVYDVQIHPTNPSIIYACTKVGCYYSTNGGTSFTKATGSESAWGERRLLAVSPASPNVVYTILSTGLVFLEIYKSTDSGLTYTKIEQPTYTNVLGIPNGLGGIANRNMAITVSPTNINEIYVGGLIVFKSIDGGSTWEQITDDIKCFSCKPFLHVDVENLKAVGNAVYATTDGGISKSTDGGATWSYLNNGLNMRQIYRMTIKEGVDDHLLVGNQDNGTYLYKDGAWEFINGGDGGDCGIGDGVQYVSSLVPSSMKKRPWTASTWTAPTFNGNQAWLYPFELDPNDPTIKYVADSEVKKQVGDEGSWTVISNFGGSNAIEFIDIAKSNSQYIYVAGESTAYVSKNGGTTWTSIRSGISGTTNEIRIDPIDENRVTVVTSGGDKVYESTNAGQTWTSIKHNLPDIAAYVVAYDGTAKHGKYLGMYGKLMYINDDMTEWIEYSDNLPKTKIYDVRVNTVSENVYAATFGRGVWKSPLYQETTTNAPTSAFSSNTQSSCTSSTITFTDQSTGTPTSWSWDFGPGATPASANTKGPHSVTYSTTGQKTVSLTVSNAGGSDDETKTDYITIGTSAANAGTITGPSSVAANTSGITYSIATVSGATGYQWQVPSGASITAGNNTNSITVTFGTNGGDVSVTPTSNCGNGLAKTKAVTITSNNAPTVSITSPANNDEFDEGNTVSITANASDDNSVSKVEFYAGNTKLGEDLTEPYSFDWTNPAVGDHNLTAVATDNDGASSTSSIVKITINTTNEICPYPDWDPEIIYENNGGLVLYNNNVYEQINHWSKNNIPDQATWAWEYIGPCTITSVTKSNITNKVDLFPNPSSGDVHLNKPIKEVVIYSLTGKKVFTAKQTNYINVKHLDSGTYIIKLNGSNSSQTERLIIK